MIALSDELERVRQYLFIQRQRYDDQLNYEIDDVSEVSHVDVPKIILQPIVENALYHGIREKDGSGHIKIRVNIDRENSMLELM